MAWLTRLYDRRIINVNVNIIAAGALALAFTVAVMHLLDTTGLLARLGGLLPNWTLPLFGREFKFYGDKVIVTVVTFVVDVVADVAMYDALHWIANHRPSRKARPKSPAYADLSFMRDATLVQFERAILSPVLYIAALSLQNNLLHQGYSVGSATAVGFAVGIVLTRVLHTMWMLRQERVAGRPSAADIVGPDTAPPEAARPETARPQTEEPPTDKPRS